MADYYPLISHAIGALDKPSEEARRALYDRARDLGWIADIESHFNPPPPPPEPTVVYVEAAEGSDQLGTSDFTEVAFVVLRSCRDGRAG